MTDIKQRLLTFLRVHYKVTRQSTPNDKIKHHLYNRLPFRDATACQLPSLAFVETPGASGETRGEGVVATQHPYNSTGTLVSSRSHIDSILFSSPLHSHSQSTPPSPCPVSTFTHPDIVGVDIIAVGRSSLLFQHYSSLGHGQNVRVTVTILAARREVVQGRHSAGRDGVKLLCGVSGELDESRVPLRPGEELYGKNSLEGRGQDLSMTRGTFSSH